MIWNSYTVLMVALASIGLALVTYTSAKAYEVYKATAAKVSAERMYELEKKYYLLSTTAWVTLVSRLVAFPFYWIANESLIPLIPGAMCQFGVHQAGAPFSWIDTGLKVVVPYLYGVWISLDILNRRVRRPKLMRTLSLGFLALTPVLFFELAMDLAFYWTVEPIVVPCCRTTFTPENPLPCPFCFVFHDAPLFIVVTTGYSLAIAAIVWAFVVRRYSRGDVELEREGDRIARWLVNLALAAAIVATVTFIPAVMQVMGPAVTH